VWGSAPQTAKVWAPAWADVQTNAMLASASFCQRQNKKRSLVIYFFFV